MKADRVTDVEGPPASASARAPFKRPRPASPPPIVVAATNNAVASTAASVASEEVITLEGDSPPRKAPASDAKASLLQRLAAFRAPPKRPRAVPSSIDLS